MLQIIFWKTKMRKLNTRTIITAAVTFLVGASLSVAGIFSGGEDKKEGTCSAEIVTDCDSKLYLVSKVIDADTIKLENGQKVRLIGVDAPEKGECYYQEGVEFATKLLKGKYVRVEKDISGVDQYDRLVRYIVIPNENPKEDNILVNDYLIESGIALSVSSAPDLRYRDLMATSQQDAIRKNLGLWKECQYEPEFLKYREQGAEPPSQDCLIKGNISERGYGKIYMVPGCDNYETTKVDLRKGEQYFCSEEKAEKAGYRKATNCP